MNPASLVLLYVKGWLRATPLQRNVVYWVISHIHWLNYSSSSGEGISNQYIHLASGHQVEVKIRGERPVSSWPSETTPSPTAERCCQLGHFVHIIY